MSEIPKRLKLYRSSWHVGYGAKERELDFESAYEPDFIKSINNIDIKKYSSDYINELFLYFFVRVEELKRASRDISSCSCSINARLVDKGMLNAMKSGSNMKIGVGSDFLFRFQALAASLITVFLVLALSLVLPFIFFFKSRESFSDIKEQLNSTKTIFFVRSKSGFSRAQTFINEDPNCLVFVDNFGALKVSGKSIYSILRSSEFFSIYFSALWYSVRDLFQLFGDARALLGGWFALSVLSEYWKRVPQKALYEACFVKILAHVQGDAELFSGEKEDRFALLQTRWCGIKRQRLTCLPHGLEYGFRFPGGLCGDSFYCFSGNAKTVLESLYPSKRFVYSDDILDKMLGIKSDNRLREIDRVCFFTEPRDREVNLEIMDYLIRADVTFSLKLHPLEDSQFYRDRYPDVEIIDDLDAALESAICLSRKSTVLVEAAQRARHSIAVLVNRKDKFYVEELFPSLSSEKITRASDFEELTKILRLIRAGEYSGT